MKIPHGRPRVSYLCCLDVNKNKSLKREGKRHINRLLIDLLTNKMFSKLTLSENFKINFFLNRGLELELSD